MHENEPNDTSEGKDEVTQPEQAPKVQPRIYVASLADYNEGRLYGRWIDADQSAEELGDAVQEMLADSPSPGAEEWAIHDYEGFGPLRLDEFESLDDVAKVAAGIARYGAVFAAWADHVGIDSELLDGFEDAYLGEYESGDAFTEEALGESGIIEKVFEQLPESLRPYVTVDYEGYFDDLVTNGEINAIERPDGSIYVFRIW
jgi:antirestriction protein